MTYVLILFTASTFNYPAISMMQFESKQLCIDAGELMKNEIRTRKYEYRCVQSSIVGPSEDAP